MIDKSYTKAPDGTQEPSARTLVLHPVIRTDSNTVRTPDARLEEAVRLARSIDLEIVRFDLVPVSRLLPSTLIGGGAVEEFGGYIDAEAIDLVVVDHGLTPVQQRNLERAWHTKVIDRTGLILEIFGARARTKEGMLQVDLAQLTYQRSRLVRSWTHLERQRGGAGFMGGPGERQIELDRRMLEDKIHRLKQQLSEVRRTRDLQRKARSRVPFPVVALVGYTNAGKSTLFNTIAGAAVHAADQLFATLDPTMRAVRLPSGTTVILSDTVGFVSDLPTHLVAAFRATLEEVEGADLILHVRDIAHAETEAQRDDVAAVLADLGIDVATDERLIEVWNKVDLLDDESRLSIDHRSKRDEGGIPVSARTAEGLGDLGAAIDQVLTRDHRLCRFHIPIADGKAMAWLYTNGDVIDRQDGDDSICFSVRMDAASMARFVDRFHYPSGDVGEHLTYLSRQSA